MMPRIVPMSEYALTIEFGDGITIRTNERVLAACAIIDQAALPGVGEVVPTYRSATVYFDPLQTDAITLTGQIQALIPHNIDAPTRPATTHIIPVWYGGAAGPDLPDVAQQADLTPIDAGRLHASVTYRVYMLGFSPGFPYLGTVPTRIATPRHPTPRRQVALVPSALQELKPAFTRRLAQVAGTLSGGHRFVCSVSPERSRSCWSPVIRYGLSRSTKTSLPGSP